MAQSCCHHKPEKEEQAEASCHPKGRVDYLLWGSLVVIALAYFSFLFAKEQVALFPSLHSFTHAVFSMMNQVWWGIAFGLIFVSILGKVPRDLMAAILGRGGTFSGILRATMAGVMFDLCSHGILLIGMKLYQRGASLGQVMAFLIASPWNSFSLTLILWALIGFKWMITFLLVSLVIALVSGIIFDVLVKRGVLPANPNSEELPENFSFFAEAKRNFKEAKFDRKFFKEMAIEGVSGSEMVLRWLFLGVILASLIRTFIPAEYFGSLFGPTLSGLALTLIAATVIEVCSEGSTPIAADLVTRAFAPGNAFAFLMTGVSTDYTEIMVLRETTKSWKIALFLPLVTLPQVVLLSYLINTFG